MKLPNIFADRGFRYTQCLRKWSQSKDMLFATNQTRMAKQMIIKASLAHGNFEALKQMVFALLDYRFDVHGWSS